MNLSDYARQPLKKVFDMLRAAEYQSIPFTNDLTDAACVSVHVRGSDELLWLGHKLTSVGATATDIAQAKFAYGPRGITVYWPNERYPKHDLA
jgi:hypothetical protein